MNYKKSAQEIIVALGGSHNIKKMSHCMTRLRVVLVDESLFDKETLPPDTLVKGVNRTGEQTQLILGTGVVNKVYKEALAIINSSGVQLDHSVMDGGIAQQLCRLFGDVFIPILPVIIASGILLGIKSFLISSGMLSIQSGYFALASAIIDTGFGFLPVLVTWSATRKFGGNPALGVLMGLILIAPQLVSPAAVSQGTAQAPILDILGYHYHLMGFQGSVLVAIAAGYLISVTEKFYAKYIPNIVDMIFTPILVIVTTSLVIFFIFGPILREVEILIVFCFRWLLTLPFGIGGFIISGLQQFIVITGLHHALWIIDIQFLNESGVNLMQPIRNCSVMGQTGTVFAFFVYALTHNGIKTKAGALSAGIAGIFGITEPAIFGYNIRYLKAFSCGCIGSAIGGMFANSIHLSAHGMGSNGVAGFLYYLSNGHDILMYGVSALITLAISFTLTFLYLSHKHIAVD